MNRLLPVVIEPKVNLRFHTHYPPFKYNFLLVQLIIAAALSEISDEQFKDIAVHLAGMREPKLND